MLLALCFILSLCFHANSGEQKPEEPMNINVTLTSFVRRLLQVSLINYLYEACFNLKKILKLQLKCWMLFYSMCLSFWQPSGCITWKPIASKIHVNQPKTKMFLSISSLCLNADFMYGHAHSPLFKMRSLYCVLLFVRQLVKTHALLLIRRLKC